MPAQLCAVTRISPLPTSNSVLRGSFIRVALFIFALLCIGKLAIAQVNLPANQTGTPVNTSSILHGVDSVNTMGLGLHIEIPLLTLQERGRTYTWKYVYNSPTYSIVFIPEPTPNNRTKGEWGIFGADDSFHDPGPDNWKLVDPYTWWLAYDVPTQGSCVSASQDAPETYQTMTNYRLYDPEGTAHPLAMSAINYEHQTVAPFGPCARNSTGTSLVSPTLDGSGAFVDLSAEYTEPDGDSANAFWLKDGTKYSLRPPSPDALQLYTGTSLWGGSSAPNVISIEDANGNYIGPDMMSRTGLTLSTSGSTKTYTYKDSNGQEQHIVIAFTDVGYETSDCDLDSFKGLNDPCYEGWGDFMLPSSIALPNGQSYSFAYNQDGHGELTDMTLPTGAQIHYTYQRIFSKGSMSGRGGKGYVKMGIATRTETVNGVQYPWTYTSSNLLNSVSFTVTVTDPNGNCSDHIYSRLVETQVTSYQGCGSSKTVLKTVNTTYTSDAFAPPGGTFGQQFNVRPTQVTVSYNNQPSSMIQTDYQIFPWGGGSGVVGTRLNPSEIREYDFGATTPTRTTDYTYLSDTGSSTVLATKYQSLNIVDKIRSKSIYSGASAGTPLSTTTYDYDNYGPSGVTSSGAVQHDTSYGNWGNVTSQTVTDNVAGASYTSKYGYEDTGNVISSTDPSNHTTAYSYTDIWNDSHCALSGSGQGHIYLTKITNPLGQHVDYTYNSCSGTLASMSDVNTQSTTLQYDGLGRTTLVTHPDGGSTQFCYSDGVSTNCNSAATAPNYMTATTTQSPSPSKSVTAIYDDLGRPVQTQLTTDGSYTDVTDTGYDGVGQVVNISNPYRSTSDPTYGVTTYQYDGLGRRTLQNNPDSIHSTVTWSYSGSTVTTTDELKNKTVRKTDGLGRLVLVKEPNGTSASASMETDYSYNTLDNLYSVQQWGGANGTTGARVRSFTYDNLSRLTQASNPETGTVIYSYNVAGALCAGDITMPCSKTDARGVKTSYSYDILNRVLSKSYSSDSSGTPWSCYQYDSSSVTNGKGRLSNSWTQRASIGTCASAAPSSGYSTMRSIQAYDPVGRVWSESQCTPAGCRSAKPCSTSGGNQSYSYDLAGNLVCFSNGIASTPGAGSNPLTFTRQFDGAGHLSQVSSTWNDNLHPPTLFSAQTSTATPCPNFWASAYTPFGALANATFGNGVTLQRAFDTRLRQTCETDIGSIIPNATGGFTTLTISGTEQIK